MVRFLQRDQVTIDWYHTALNDLQGVLERNPDTIIFEADVTRWETFLDGMLRAYTSSGRLIPYDVLNDVINVTAEVFDLKMSDIFTVELDVKER